MVPEQLSVFFASLPAAPVADGGSESLTSKG